MKSLLALVALSLTSFSARADLILPATLDLVCTSDQANLFGNEEIRIVSNTQGSSVTIQGKTYRGEQLIGGTEGGAPYLQAVNNAGSYNITLSGGDFEVAILKGKTIKNGSAPASVNLIKQNKFLEVTCRGLFQF